MKKLLTLLFVSCFIISAMPMPSQTPLISMRETAMRISAGTIANLPEKKGIADDDFELAVEMIKKYESLHTVANWPYIGYGHRVKKGENFSRRNLTEKEAEDLLRKDLTECISYFTDFGDDALMLGVLAYSVGPYRILGAGNKIAKSKLLTKLENGDRDIKDEYLSFSKFRGRTHKSLQKRRLEEFEAFYAD